MKNKNTGTKSKQSFTKTGELRPGNNTPGPHSIEHPEKNPQSGRKQKSLSGIRK
jgi:hypothetical protein